VHFADRKAQVERVDRHIRDAFKDLSGQVQLSASLPATDPELVLIFEALDERVDLESMASKMGFEVLTEVDSFEDPTDEFQLLSDKTRNPTIGSCIHAVCVDSTSLLRIQKKWKEYKHRVKSAGMRISVISFQTSRTYAHGVRPIESRAGTGIFTFQSASMPRTFRWRLNFGIDGAPRTDRKRKVQF